MTKKNVFIFGAGLYGLILAVLLNKKKYNVTIVDQSDEILSGFRPIRISKYLLNNGFHGIDYPRSKKLISFLDKRIKFKLNKFAVQKKIIIEKFIVDYLDRFEEFPKKLKQIYKEKNLKFYKNQNYNFFFSRSFKKNLLINAKRYSSEAKVSEGFFLPYFLPSDTKHISKDEGDTFRNKIRNNKIKSFCYLPKNGIFFSLKNKFSKVLKKQKIKILKNSKIIIDKNLYIKIINKNSEISLPKETKIFFCMSSVFFLKYEGHNLLRKLSKNKRDFYNVLIKIKKEDEKNTFTESLVLNKKIFYVNRITKNHFIKDSKFNFYQIELLINKITNTEKIKKDLQSELSKILKCKIHFVGLKLSRITFHPSKNWFINAKSIVKKIIKKLPYNISIRYSFYPVNMNKAWIWANEDVKD